jgi:hypothetical protein
MNNFTKEELEEKVNMLYEKEVSRVFIESRLLEEIEHLKKAQHDLKQLIQIASNDIVNALIEKLKNENY